MSPRCHDDTPSESLHTMEDVFGTSSESRCTLDDVFGTSPESRCTMDDVFGTFLKHYTLDDVLIGSSEFRRTLDDVCGTSPDYRRFVYDHRPHTDALPSQNIVNSDDPSPRIKFVSNLPWRSPKEAPLPFAALS
ncbi:unnamed protein product [Heligmosomoides polygyrus]|uniref:Uncharacterized protein n=1 Tax=Heligmosomoides polygyrus TaxID=6339 RepID=A0A183GL79_HELPZ|nr:unnamed protein product [Heligmosomoides polygyrus]